MPIAPWSWIASEADLAAELAGQRLRGGDDAAALQRVARVDRHRRGAGHRLHLLERDQHVGDAVLQHLELGQRSAELLACPEVLGGEVEQRFDRAGGFGAQRGGGAVDGGFEQGQRFTRRADDGIGTDLTHRRSRHAQHAGRRAWRRAGP